MAIDLVSVAPRRMGRKRVNSMAPQVLSGRSRSVEEDMELPVVVLESGWVSAPQPSLGIGLGTQSPCDALIHALCGVLAPGCVSVFTHDG